MGQDLLYAQTTFLEKINDGTNIPANDNKQIDGSADPPKNLIVRIGCKIGV